MIIRKLVDRVTQKLDGLSEIEKSTTTEPFNLKDPTEISFDGGVNN